MYKFKKSVSDYLLKITIQRLKAIKNLLLYFLTFPIKRGKRS